MSSAYSQQEREQLAADGLRALRRATEKALRRQVVTLEDLEDATRRLEAAGFDIADSSPVMTQGIVFTDDPNLALASLRIELERRLRRTASNEPRILDLIYESRRFTEPQSSALVHLVTLLNSAVHGADVTKDAPAWVEQTGSRIVSAIAH